MRRRDFITFIGGAAVLPFAVRAQQAKAPTVGFLHYARPAEATQLVAKFGAGLNESGFAEGRDVSIEYRWAEGQRDRVPSLVADLVKQEVFAIMAAGPPMALAAKAATTRIPIVFTSGADPVEIGLVESMHRPGANVTGVYIFANELEAKRLGLLHAMVPQASPIAVLVNPTGRQTARQLGEAQDAAGALRLALHVQNASSEKEFDAAFESIARQQAGALLVLSDPFFFSQRERLVALAARYRLPAMYEWSEFARAGGLMSYGANLGEGYRQAGVYVGRILKGERPAQLPVMQSTQFALAINLKTAKTLALTVPPSLLATADEVIE